ncbi:MAG: SUMF1/EgtB/PvdO family nonheme iron enzyme, partial [Gammaproteobacteria bacterium]|nr:SUMF1/EgtB/PvdO family nonheme iron enzyme [Gammaproteobacteria bacterium]
MSAEIADRLRALARDHLEGRSSLQSYRRQRAQLLDSLVVLPAGGSPEATQPRAAMQLGEVTQPRAAALPQAAAERPAPPSADIESKMGRGRIAAYVALGLLLIFAVALLVSRHHLRGAAAPHGTAATSSGAGEGTAQTDPIQALLQPLLENPDWSDDRLLALNEALLEAGRARLEAVSNTDWYQAFLESVRSRLRQQQALAGTPLTPDSSPLAALAVTLGIDLSAQAESAKSAAPAQGGPGAAAPRKSAVPQRSAEQAKPAQHAAGAEASPRGKSESSLAPAQHATDITGSVAVKPGSSPAANPVTASTPAAPQNAPAKASAHHEYPACSAALSQTRRNYCQDFLASGDSGPLLAVIPGGSFMMGNGGLAQEGPVHRVTLSHGFAMSVYEVSQAEF